MLTRSRVDVGDVEQIAAVVGNQRIDDQDLRAEIDELVREVAANEAEAAGDQHAAAGVERPVLAHEPERRCGDG
jgi:hypothetical protein